MYPSPTLNLNRETEDTVYFFTSAFYPLDNYSAHQISIWWEKFPTAEHAFQWKKFSTTNPEVAEEIMQAASPEIVKNISIRCQDKIPAHWWQERVKVMSEILYAKTLQHNDTREILLKTGTKKLVENSPIDSFWWLGQNGDWQNMVGEIWEEIRSKINNTK